MSLCQLFVSTLVIILIVIPPCDATLSTHDDRKIKSICPTITVDPSGDGNFTTIQAAIDSVPSNNDQWICVRVKAGTYREQVKIAFDKPYISLKGEGRRKTHVVWDAYGSIATGATFISQADNIVARGFTFMNSHNYPLKNGSNMTTTLAARIEGDKSAFYRCNFIGVQDTLWDVQGRHYFKYCTIYGAIDFIFGSGQSLYENCILSVDAAALGVPGYITAQGRSQPNETNGFVFKNSKIIGNGVTYLGRPWRDYARVIFYHTLMADIIVPQGWDAWFTKGHEDRLTFDEIGCRGPGSNTSQRVSWANKMITPELASLSYINDGDWL